MIKPQAAALSWLSKARFHENQVKESRRAMLDYCFESECRQSYLTVGK